MNTPFDKHAGQLIGSTKNCYVLLDRYEHCIEPGNPDEPLKELDKVAIYFRVFTLSDKEFYELGQTPSVTNVFAIDSERSQRKVDFSSILLNPVYSFTELSIQSYKQVQRLLTEYNLNQFDHALLTEAKWKAKHQEFPHSDEISKMLEYLQMVIGRYEIWFSDNSQVVNRSLQNISHQQERGIVKKMVSKYAFERELKKGETVPAPIIRSIYNLIVKQGISTTERSVGTTLQNLGYSDPFKSKQ